MRPPMRYLLIGATAILAAAAGVKAESWPLELKRIKSQGPGAIFSDDDYLYRYTSPQDFFMQLGKNITSTADQSQAALFRKIVKKEPKYACDHPFRGVARLGSQEFAFAIDALRQAPASKDKRPPDDKAKPEVKSPTPDPAVALLSDALLKMLAPSNSSAPSVTGYNRLYFDFNRNGDLTDDKPVDAEPSRDLYSFFSADRSYSQFQFPRLDVTLDDAGTKLDYSFFLQGRETASPDFSYLVVSLNAATYREGDITLEGKKRHVVLLDFNSNGRFDDEIRIRDDVHAADGRIYPQQGDMLLIDPGSGAVAHGSPFEVTGNEYRQYVSKLVNIDGRFYDLTITPAGDRLTLTPSKAALGSVKNRNEAFKALIYGRQGFLKIGGNKDAAIPVPEGRWKLFSYTIIQTKTAESSKPAEKKDAQQTKKGASVMESLTKEIEGMFGGALGPAPSRPQFAMVTAEATDAYAAVEVVKGKTVELPFGPPYKPVVRADYFVDEDQHGKLSLGMSLVGSAGEICSDMTIDGQRPPNPDFTITDAKQKVVQQGNFEYG